MVFCMYLPDDDTPYLRWIACRRDMAHGFGEM